MLTRCEVGVGRGQGLGEVSHSGLSAAFLLHGWRGPVRKTGGVPRSTGGNEAPRVGWASEDAFSWASL